MTSRQCIGNSLPTARWSWVWNVETFRDLKRSLSLTLSLSLFLFLSLFLSLSHSHTLTHSLTDLFLSLPHSLFLSHTAALSQALFVRPDLLLLDEPTNHLDVFACTWLEMFLNRCACACVCVCVACHELKRVHTTNYSAYACA